jgi:hypothetical protein
MNHSGKRSWDEPRTTRTTRKQILARASAAPKNFHPMGGRPRLAKPRSFGVFRVFRGSNCGIRITLQPGGLTEISRGYHPRIQVINAPRPGQGRRTSLFQRIEIVCHRGTEHTESGGNGRIPCRFAATQHRSSQKPKWILNRSKQSQRREDFDGKAAGITNRAHLASTTVAQTASMLPPWRDGVAIRRRRLFRALGRLPVGETADWQSALR